VKKHLSSSEQISHHIWRSKNWYHH